MKLIPDRLEDGRIAFHVTERSFSIVPYHKYVMQLYKIFPPSNKPVKCFLPPVHKDDITVYHIIIPKGHSCLIYLSTGERVFHFHQHDSVFQFSIVEGEPVCELLSAVPVDQPLKEDEAIVLEKL